MCVQYVSAFAFVCAHPTSKYLLTYNDIMVTTARINLRDSNVHNKYVTVNMTAVFKSNNSDVELMALMRIMLQK